MAEYGALGGFSSGLTAGIGAANNMQQLRQQRQQMEQQAQQAQQEMELRRQTIEISRKELGMKGLEQISKKYEANLNMLVDAIDKAPDSGRATAILQSLQKNGVLKGLDDMAEISGSPANAKSILMSRVMSKQSEEEQLAMKGKEAGVVAEAQASAQSRFAAPSYQPIYTDQGVLSFNNRAGQATPLQSSAGTPVMPINANPELAAQMAAGRAGGAVTGARSAGASPGQKAIDTAFGQEYAAFNASGGFADVQKSLSQLASAAEKLDEKGNISGPVVGNVPDFIGGFVNPEAIATREEIQEVAQRNLRLVLGAQFTEKEGDKLIQRVFNPSLQEGTNKERVRLLAEQIATAAAAKQEAGQYFDQNGTLAGFQGKLYTINDFVEGIDLFDKKAKQQEGAAKPDKEGWRKLPNGIKVRVKQQ